MCFVDVAWRQCMLEARFLALSFRHLVCVCVAQCGWLRTECRQFFFFSLRHRQQQTGCTHAFMGWKLFTTALNRFNLNINVSHWQFLVGIQHLCALTIKNLVFFFGKPRRSGRMAQDGFSSSCFQHFKKLEMKFEKWTLITRIFVVSFSIHETNLMTLLDRTVRVHSVLCLKHSPQRKAYFQEVAKLTSKCCSKNKTGLPTNWPPVLHTKACLKLSSLAPRLNLAGHGIYVTQTADYALSLIKCLFSLV